jgi:WD40 repeat protein
MTHLPVAHRKYLGCGKQAINIPSDGVYSLSWSSNEKYLSSGSRDGILRSWEIEKCNLLESLDFQVEKTFSITLSTKDDLIAVETFICRIL